jgi:2-epi-5-epi-valiolone synthase
MRSDYDREGAIASLRTERRARFDIVRSSVLAGPLVSELESLTKGRPALVVVSPTVERIYGHGLRSILVSGRRRNLVHLIQTGEKNKSLESVAELLEIANKFRLSRDAMFVGIGGGVLLDIVGFAASQFRRGTGHVKIGTTLLAQVDAAVSIKCGVNIGTSKNLAGAFHPPERVIVDGAFLRTVSERDIRCGLAEMVKLGVAADSGLFEGLVRSGRILLDSDARDSDPARELVDASIRGMVGELAENPFEHDLSRRVDLGHTISPALEAATGYKLPHGEAVAVDVALSAVISNRMGILDDMGLDSVLELFRGLGIGTWHRLLEDFALIEAALDDAEAHRGRRLRLPLPLAIGRTVFVDDREDLPPSLIRESVAQLREASE